MEGGGFLHGTRLGGGLLGGLHALADTRDDEALKAGWELKVPACNRTGLIGCYMYRIDQITHQECMASRALGILTSVQRNSNHNVRLPFIPICLSQCAWNHTSNW